MLSHSDSIISPQFWPPRSQKGWARTWEVFQICSRPCSCPCFCWWLLGLHGTLARVWFYPLSLQMRNQIQKDWFSQGHTTSQECTWVGSAVSGQLPNTHGRCSGSHFPLAPLTWMQGGCVWNKPCRTREIKDRASPYFKLILSKKCSNLSRATLDSLGRYVPGLLSSLRCCWELRGMLTRKTLEWSNLFPILQQNQPNSHSWALLQINTWLLDSEEWGSGFIWTRWGISSFCEKASNSFFQM